VVIDHRPKETEMPGMTPPVADERAGLLAFLQQQRNAVHISAFGVTDEQARTAASISALTVGGLIKHLADMERTWTATMTQQPGGLDAMDYLDHFRLTDDESLEDALAEYAAAAAATDAAVAVLLHLIEETAKHAGHADVIRESIDGATVHPLMAAVEGWPQTPWLKPWQPADELALTNPS
jgi:hypothetical protein